MKFEKKAGTKCLFWNKFSFLRVCLCQSVMVFSFLPKNVHFVKKKKFFLCLFLKNVSPFRRVLCFILNNPHLSLVEGIKFYALNKSRELPIKQTTFFVYKATRWNLRKRPEKNAYSETSSVFWEFVPKCAQVFSFLTKKCAFR